MLTFLRKIRRSLIESSSGQKYLLYAIGEIALVVIGILIALQINNWNQTRIERIVEKKILTDLRQELMTNKQKVENQIDRRMAMKGPVDQYMQKLSEGNVNLDDFAKIHEVTFFTGRINPSYSVINSIISSGEIKLITDDSLKYLITDWPDQMGDFVEIEHTIFEGHRSFEEYFNMRYPSKGNQIHGWSRTKRQNAFEQILKDVEYANRLVRIQGHLNVGTTNGVKTVQHIDEMIELIDDKISER